jgi:simple sugar transport system permease protein
MPEWLRGVVRISAALVSAFLLTIMVIKLAHGDPRAALSALAGGAFGSPYELGNTLNKMTPLLLTGLGIAIAFRARLWNIGGEGQFLVGALAASAIGAYGLKGLPAAVLIPLLLLGGALAGAFWAGLAGMMRVRRGVPEVISTIMLNFIAAQLVSYLVGSHGPMQEASRAQPASEALPPNAMLPVIWPGTSLHAGILIALLCAAVAAVFLSGTRGGFALRVVGANPDAARTAGIDVERTQMATMLISGALCGLAGAVELSGLIGTVYENYAPGYGFTAIAVALLGRLSPSGIIASALFFGALAAGSGEMERSAGVSSVLVYVIQATALLVLLGFQWVRWERHRSSDDVLEAAGDGETASRDQK